MNKSNLNSFKPKRLDTIRYNIACWLYKKAYYWKCKYGRALFGKTMPGENDYCWEASEKDLTGSE